MDETPNLPALPEQKRPTTREARRNAVKPWRTSKRLKRRFRKILSSKELYNSLEEIIKDPKNPHFMRAMELMLRYAEIPVVDPIADDGEDAAEGLQPTALPPVVRTKETVTKIFNEAGDLVKVIGKKEARLGKGTQPPSSNIIDAEYTVEGE
jgi:hypothetical protein